MLRSLPRFRRMLSQWPPAALLFLALLSGCAVRQPHGVGLQRELIEPRTGRAFFLYLPKPYIDASQEDRVAHSWPLVMTFHGMNPFDAAHYQAHEWELDADRYGFIVVAPYLTAFDLWEGEFPLETYNDAFAADIDAVLAILDHVLETTEADPQHVLATAWSSGGYIAHYLLNQYPERFSCLAIRQGHFTSNFLQPDAVPRSLYHPILIVSSQKDFKLCKAETREAIHWYEAYGYKNLAWVCLARLPHARTPEIAADFFARVVGAKPATPPAVLVSRQIVDGNERGLALLEGRLAPLERDPARAQGNPAAPPGRRPRTPPRPLPPAKAAESSEPQPALVKAAEPAAKATDAAEDGAGEPPPRTSPTLARGAGIRPAEARSPVSIRVSVSVGFEPLLLAYSAECPADWRDSATFVWKLGGEEIGRGPSGQRLLTSSGDYELTLEVTTRGGAVHQASRSVRVLEDVAAGPTSRPAARAGTPSGQPQ